MDYVTIYKKRTRWAWLAGAETGDGFDTARQALDDWTSKTEDRAVPIYVEREP